jgi:hypothetical protein
MRPVEDHEAGRNRSVALTGGNAGVFIRTSWPCTISGGTTASLTPSCARGFVSRQGGWQDLDGDIAPERRVRGAVDLLHPAFAKLVQDSILA